MASRCGGANRQRLLELLLCSQTNYLLHILLAAPNCALSLSFPPLPRFHEKKNNVATVNDSLYKLHCDCGQATDINWCIM